MNRQGGILVISGNPFYGIATEVHGEPDSGASPIGRRSELPMRGGVLD